MKTAKTIRALAGYLRSLPSVWINGLVRQLIIQDLKARGLVVARDAIVYGSARIACSGPASVGAFSVIWCGDDEHGHLKDGRLIIGKNVYIGDHCCIRASGCPVTIGDNTLIANGVTIVSANHGIRRDQLITGQPWEADGKEVVIGCDVWVGAHVTILPGVTVSDGSIIAAGAVVRSFVPPNEIWGGVPAKKLRDR